ncbi:hypothetical protein PVAND_003040 [Polypedilum vanderplanki]|uniref:Glycine rich protein n=1 Tax=Polypedilum vanderplanki TaxID=319348 RepID=A0A9J6BSU1_POLVA|nr:hypothetical protein PVAND_003040 [Polypedilum vanderplanki]
MFKLIICLSLLVCVLSQPIEERLRRDTPVVAQQNALPASGDAVDVGERFGGFGGGHHHRGHHGGGFGHQGAYNPGFGGGHYPGGGAYGGYPVGGHGGAYGNYPQGGGFGGHGYGR